MNKQLKIVLSIIIVFAMAVNLALVALQIPVVEFDPDAEIESELNDLEADLFGKCVTIHIIGMLTMRPQRCTTSGYLLRLFQTHIRFVPFFRSDLHGLSPPQLTL